MILNKTSDELIDIEIRYADNFFKRLKGLTFKRNIDFGLLFCNMKNQSIHTHFMMHEIDVYFINKRKVVVEKATLRPWQFYKPEKEVAYILETKKDSLKLKIGDRLEFL